MAIRGAAIGTAAGRAAAPPRLWLLGDLDPAAARDLEQWLDDVARLPVQAWFRIADRCGAPDRPRLAVECACARLECIIAANRLELTAWLVRDLVDSTLFRIAHPGPRPSRADRARLCVARVAVERAALAIACRPWLPPSDVDLLCAPVAELPALSDSRMR
jgi:hypothetical protein